MVNVRAGRSELLGQDFAATAGSNEEYSLGAQIPASWSLDFAVVLTFIALLVPAVRTRADLAAAIVAAGVALVAAGLPYRLALVVASIAGIAAGMAIERGRRHK